jgi:hypothetical protein
VFTVRPIYRPAILCALLCALLVSAMSAAAAGQSSPHNRAAALAQEQYYSSYADPQPSSAATAAAQSQERYYSSYGKPQPLPPPPGPSNDAPWLPIALAIASITAIMGASTTQVRRLRNRRRRAARVAT